MNLKRIFCFALAGMMLLSLTACGKKNNNTEPSVEASEEPQTEETITAIGIELVTGLVTRLEGDSVSTNGVWMTEAQVGQVAKTFTSETYKCERKSLKQSDVKLVSILYNIDNDIACTLYFDEAMNIYYNNKYLITAPDIKTLYKDIADTITTGSVIEFPTANSNNTSNDDNNVVNPNNDLSISVAMLQTNIGLDEQTARVLAESASKVGVPTIMKAQMAAQDVIRTYDINNNTYLIAIQGGAILYIYNETSVMYMYAADGYDTRYVPNVPSPQQPVVQPDPNQVPSQETPIDPTQQVPTETIQPETTIDIINQPQEDTNPTQGDITINPVG